MRILALDLGCKTGWATLDTDSRFEVESGVQEFVLQRGDSPGMRYLAFRAWLSRIGDQTLPDLIVYEQNFRRGGAATEIAAGFSTRVQEWCAEHGVECTSVNVSTLKKQYAGHGRADKEVLAQKMGERWGRADLEAGDEADALAVLAWAVDTLTTEGEPA